MIRKTLFSFLKKNNSANKPNYLLNRLSYLNYSSFSTSSEAGKEEYHKKFLVRLIFQHSSDAYYETYPYREQFRKQVKQLQDLNKCHLFGGDLFPMQGSLFVINCDQKSTLQEFFQNTNVYAKNKLIKNVQIEQVQQISEEKMKKLSYFYQYK